MSLADQFARWLMFLIQESLDAAKRVVENVEEFITPAQNSETNNERETPEPDRLSFSPSPDAAFPSNTRNSEEAAVEERVSDAPPWGPEQGPDAARDSETVGQAFMRYTEGEPILRVDTSVSITDSFGSYASRNLETEENSATLTIPPGGGLGVTVGVNDKKAASVGVSLSAPASVASASVAYNISTGDASIGLRALSLQLNIDSISSPGFDNLIENLTREAEQEIFRLYNLPY
ncbi:hypothetical protein O4G98_05185 [Zoogloeaceae bacterium G21618-S1]|nr:hypothetical protein [Zoogloeaceae bacterium G21618-S1]